jgi:hypothetical protein
VKRSPILEGLVLVVLVVSGVALRLLFRDLPNFAPVAALAMFSGFFFRGWLVALSAPLMVMSLSNLVIGGYHPALMVAVYGMLAIPWWTSSTRSPRR